jgi:hypothetical protein
MMQLENCYEYEITSREIAIERGLDRYFTGKPCSRGHVAERNRSGSCMKCKKEDNARRHTGGKGGATESGKEKAARKIKERASGWPGRCEASIDMLMKGRKFEDAQKKRANKPQRMRALRLC